MRTAFYFFHTFRHEFQNARLLAVYGSRRRGGGITSTKEVISLKKPSYISTLVHYVTCLAT